MKPVNKLKGEKIAHANKECGCRKYAVEAVRSLIKIDHPARKVGALFCRERAQPLLDERRDQEHGEYLQHGSVPRDAVVEHHAEADDSEQQQQSHAACADDGKQQKADRGDADEMHRSASHQLDEGHACGEQRSACRHPGKADLPRGEPHFLPHPAHPCFVVQRLSLDAIVLRQHQIDMRQLFAQVYSSDRIINSHGACLFSHCGQRDGDDVRRLHLSPL